MITARSDLVIYTAIKAVIKLRNKEREPISEGSK